MKNCNILLLVVMALCTSCSTVATRSPTAHWEKVELDLAQLDENGLRGPVNGKVMMAYEFAIPNTGECKAEVRAIDPSVQFMQGSRGRIGASKDECLCIGETGPDYHAVLGGLSSLVYIDRIIECHFE